MADEIEKVREMPDNGFISPEEQAHYCRLFRQVWLSDIAEVFKRGEEELFELLRRLRSRPKYTSFSLCSGLRLQFLTVEKMWVNGGLRLLFSDGTVGGYQPVSFPCARVLDEEMGPPVKSPWPEEELMPLFLRRDRHLEQYRSYLPVEQRALPANGETKTALRHFGCEEPLARETVEQLALLGAPVPDENFAIVVRQWRETGKTSPKQLLLWALEKAVNSALSAKLSGERLWQLLYDGTNPMGMTIKELVSGHEAGEARYREAEYHRVITRSILNFASQFDDLVTTPLWTHSFLDATLETAYEVGFLEPEKTGGTLAGIVAAKLGFRRVANGWTKADERCELHVTDEADVYLNQAKLCLHPINNQSLPRGDVTAGLLMTLATNLRRCILSGKDLEAVEALLPLKQSVTALKGLTKQKQRSESHEKG